MSKSTRGTSKPLRRTSKRWRREPESWHGEASYDEKEAFKPTPQANARRLKARQKQDAYLGFTLARAA